VENGHTVPAMGTLEKMARALEIPMYQLFYDGDEPPKLLNRRTTCALEGRWCYKIVSSVPVLRDGSKLCVRLA